MLRKNKNYFILFNISVLEKNESYHLAYCGGAWSDPSLG